MLFRPFSGVNIGSLYLQYFYFIDAIVYLILFLGLTQYVFGKVYKSADGKPAREAKIIAVGVGLALTFAMAVFELQTGFNLGRLSWYAALILYILLYFFLFSILKGMFDDVKIAFCISNLIMYGVLYSTFYSLYYWIEYNIPLLMALLSVALVISFICVLLQLFKLFSGGGNTGRDGRDDKDGTSGKDGPSGKDGGSGKSGENGPPGKDAEIKPTPKIIIEAPPITHIREFKSTEPIPLVWRVENVTEPYHCFISTLPRLGAVIPVAEERGNNTHRYAITDLRNHGHRYNFPPTNEYGIFIRLLNNRNEPILDPNTENEVFAKVDITVVDDKTKEPPHVDISVPPHTPSGGTPPLFKPGEHIPLKFKTTNVQMPYPYLVHIFDATKKPIGKLEGTSHNETVTAPNINISSIIGIAPLPKGGYFIHVQVQDSTTGTTVEDVVTFIVDDGTGPPPEKNWIKITKPTATKSPYKSEYIPITFDVKGPDHGPAEKFEATIKVFNAKTPSVNILYYADRCIGLNHTGLQQIPPQLPGTYEVWVITSKKGKYLARDRQIFIVKDPKPKGHAIYNIIVNGVSGVGKTAFNSGISSTKPITFEIENSGTAGKIIYKISHDPWLIVKPTENLKGLVAGKKDIINVSINSTQLTGQKTAIIKIQAYTGPKTPVAESYIYLNII